MLTTRTQAVEQAQEISSQILQEWGRQQRDCDIINSDCSTPREPRC